MLASLHLRKRKDFALSLICVGLALGVAVFVSSRAYSEPDSPGRGDEGGVLISEDFESYPVGSIPPNWTVESPGYGSKGIWVEKNFQGTNQYLRGMSFSNQRLILSHNMTASADGLRIRLRLRIEEKKFFNESQDTVSFCLGLETADDRKVKLMELGRSDNQTILPFNVWYAENAWIPFEVALDLDSLTSSVYVWGSLVGSRPVEPLEPSEIRSVYLLLGGGAWYVGKFDDIQVEGFPIVEGPSTLVGILILLSRSERRT